MDTIKKTAHTISESVKDAFSGSSHPTTGTTSTTTSYERDPTQSGLGEKSTLDKAKEGAQQMGHSVSEKAQEAWHGVKEAGTGTKHSAQEASGQSSLGHGLSESMQRAGHKAQELGTSAKHGVQEGSTSARDRL